MWRFGLTPSDVHWPVALNSNSCDVGPDGLKTDLQREQYNWGRPAVSRSILNNDLASPCQDCSVREPCDLGCLWNSPIDLKGTYGVWNFPRVSMHVCHVHVHKHCTNKISLRVSVGITSRSCPVFLILAAQVPHLSAGCHFLQLRSRGPDAAERSCTYVLNAVEGFPHSYLFIYLLFNRSMRGLCYDDGDCCKV